MGVIKSHMMATSALFEAIENMEKVVADMPDCREKYRMEAHLIIMRDHAEEYAENSANIYDGMLGFAQAVAR